MSVIDILDLINKYGVGFVVLGCVIFLLFTYFYNIIKKSEDKELQIDLKNHSFFSKMELFRQRLDTIPIKNEIKQLMVIDFMNIKFEEFKNAFYELVINTDFNKLSKTELCSLISKTMYNSINAYEKKAVEIGIPELFIKKFAAWHEHTVVLVDEKKNDVINSDTFVNNVQKMVVILGVFEMAFYLTLQDAKITMDAINGQLKDCIYQNKRIGDYEN